MSKSGTVRQIFQLIWERKAWWLVPMVVVFLLVGLLIATTAGNPLSLVFAPPLFLYANYSILGA
jgi:flagellar biosynthesis protein FliQ